MGGLTCSERRTCGHSGATPKVRYGVLRRKSRRAKASQDTTSKSACRLTEKKKDDNHLREKGSDRWTAGTKKKKRRDMKGNICGPHNTPLGFPFQRPVLSFGLGKVNKATKSPRP